MGEAEMDRAEMCKDKNKKITGRDKGSRKAELKRAWERFEQYLYVDAELGLELDISRVDFPPDYFAEMEPRLRQAYQRMQELEGGAVVNLDEKRMVGHYWLSEPELAPTDEICEEIRAAVAQVREFAQGVRTGTICGERGRPFRNVLVIGIGGSGLGTRFVADALGDKGGSGTDFGCSLYFLDNTDPAGMDRVFAGLAGELDATLTVVVSKSGKTVETRNGMEEAQHIYTREGLRFGAHAVCLTQRGSRLDKIRAEEGWLAGFPVWEWVGGRTSVLSPVGLLPLALKGIDIEALRAGARLCNSRTRVPVTAENPAALLALMWFYLTKGQGGKSLVILPYKDSLELLGKYLQQLIMESLGKERDWQGNLLRHGLTVFGNKGSSDQHSYLQQLLDGPDDFLAIFVEALKDREGPSPLVGENSTSGDYLQAFLLGTRQALSAKGKKSLTITIEAVEARSIGMLIALFERAVGYYAFLTNINAYHQPAVELAKRGADEVIRLKNRIVEILRDKPGETLSVEELAQILEGEAAEGENDAEAGGGAVDREMVYKILQHLRING